ncbi:MAG: phosphoribosylanthranilate isomerase [Bacillota bacterium]
MIPVKICGITNLFDALCCIENGVAALGFVFAPSKRRINVAKAFEIVRVLPPFVTRVGVFVDEDPLVIKEILKDCRLDLAQLHGAETAAVSEILPGRVIKAFKAGLDQPDPAWKGLPLRAILVDSYSPQEAGGTGRSFNWDLFAGFRVLGYPLILAGGLNPNNIQTAIRAARPDGVDLSSGVEERPGQKDPTKIEKLMEGVRNLNLRSDVSGG